MIKLPAFKQKCLYYNIHNNFVSVKDLEILFRNIDEGINCKILLWLRHLPPAPLPIFTV